MCAGLATTGAKPPSLGIRQTGIQYTPPVASIAAMPQPPACRKASRASSPSVVVSNVLCSRATLPSRIARTQATTLSLRTSSPAARSCIASMIASIVAPPARTANRVGS